MTTYDDITIYFPPVLNVNIYENWGVQLESVMEQYEKIGTPHAPWFVKSLVKRMGWCDYFHVGGEEQSFSLEERNGLFLW